jgi:hypothetical protein
MLILFVSTPKCYTCWRIRIFFLLLFIASPVYFFYIRVKCVMIFSILDTILKFFHMFGIDIDSDPYPAKADPTRSGSGSITLVSNPPQSFH